jgi:hypothetical protein
MQPRLQSSDGGSAMSNDDYVKYLHEKSREKRNVEIITIVLTMIFIGLIVGLIYGVQKYKCAAGWQGTHETEFGLFSGCRVAIDGKLMPEANVRTMQ